MLKWFLCISRTMRKNTTRNNGILTAANQGLPATGLPLGNGGTGGTLKTTINTISAATGWPVLSQNNFTLTEPGKILKAGTITIKGEGEETAEFDAAFINDLQLLLEVINELPDEHPMGDLKHDLRNRRAFKKLGG